MTSTRRQRKTQLPPVLSRSGRALGLAFVLMAASAAPHPLDAATTERIVSDLNTGLAINGIDPVAYFTDKAPLLGLAAFEYRFGGVIWRFRNAGNRAAFAENPQVYMPRYGGYDPVAIGRGVAVPGNPLLWVIARQRLYLFYSNEARVQFLANIEKAITAAELKWPSVTSTLVP